MKFTSGLRISSSRHVRDAGGSPAAAQLTELIRLTFPPDSRCSNMRDTVQLWIPFSRNEFRRAEKNADTAFTADRGISAWQIHWASDSGNTFSLSAKPTAPSAGASLKSRATGTSRIGTPLSSATNHPEIRVETPNVSRKPSSPTSAELNPRLANVSVIPISQASEELKYPSG